MSCSAGSGPATPRSVPSDRPSTTLAMTGPNASRRRPTSSRRRCSDVAGDVPARELAFVLGGGGVLGAHEVGMLQALAECNIKPDIVLGTSVGAINGAFFAADPTLAGVERLSELWQESNWSERSPGAALRRVTTLARSGTHLES